MDIEIEAEKIYLKNKVVSKLDLFVADFINILKKYTDYVVVSGYVSILFGRSRGIQNAFKLYLGSNKDIEDAAYLYEIFSGHLSKFKIKHFMDILGVKRGDYGFEI
jgi:hypothetical protein